MLVNFWQDYTSQPSKDPTAMFRQTVERSFRMHFCTCTYIG